MSAVFAFFLALILAALGQGMGSVLGGCHWIGITTPVHLPVWALVNQPTMIFPGQNAATGYWLGSTILPLLMALLAVLAIPRARTLGAEVLWLQIGWACAVVGGCWLPLLDAKDGHISHWLSLQDLPEGLVWGIPLLASVLCLVPATRLLALLRQTRRELSRKLRIGVVLLYLVVPVLVWVALVSLVRGQLLLPATLAVLAPVLAVLMLAWARYPRPFVHQLEPIRGGSLAWMLVLLVLIGAWFTVAGRPLPEARASGLQWRVESAYNNIRPWVEPLQLFHTTATTATTADQ